MKPENLNTSPHDANPRTRTVILVDTNVFVDLWSNDPVWGEWPEKTLVSAAEQTTLAVNPIIYAELCIGFAQNANSIEYLPERAYADFPTLRRRVSRSTRVCHVSKTRRKTETLPLPDFFIGAHALVERLTLVTRDAARYRTYFPNVHLITPN